MRVHIRGTHEDFYIDDVRRDWTVQMLRNAVANRVTPPVASDRVKLILMGRVLRDESTLSEVNITENQTVHMIVRSETAHHENQSTSTNSATNTTTTTTTTNPTGINVESFTTTTQDMSEIANIMNGLLRGQHPTASGMVPNIFGGLQGAMQVSQLFSRGLNAANNNGESGTHNPSQNGTNGATAANRNTSPPERQSAGNATSNVQTVQPHVEVIAIATDDNRLESHLNNAVHGLLDRGRDRQSTRRSRSDHHTNNDTTTRAFQSPQQLGRVVQQYMYTPQFQPLRYATVSGVQVHLHVSLAEMEQVPQAVDRLNTQLAAQYQTRAGSEIPVSMAGSGGGINFVPDNAPVPSNVFTAVTTGHQSTSARTPTAAPTSPARTTSAKAAPSPSAARNTTHTHIPSPASVMSSTPPASARSATSEPINTSVVSRISISSIPPEALLPKMFKTVLGKLEMPIDFMLLQQGDWSPLSKTRIKVNDLLQNAINDVKATHLNCEETVTKCIIAAASAKEFVRNYVYNNPVVVGEVARHSKPLSSIRVNPVAFIERAVFHIMHHLIEMYTSTPSDIHARDPYKINSLANSSHSNVFHVSFHSLPASDRSWCLTVRMGLVKTIGSALMFAEREIAANGRRDVEEILGHIINMIIVEFIIPEIPLMEPMRVMAAQIALQTMFSWKAEYINVFLERNVDICNINSDEWDDEKLFTEEITDYEAKVRQTAAAPAAANPPASKAGEKKKRSVEHNTVSSVDEHLDDPDTLLELVINATNESTGEPDAKKEARSEARDNNMPVNVTVTSSDTVCLEGNIDSIMVPLTGDNKDKDPSNSFTSTNIELD